MKKKALREFRLIPIVLVAAGSLLVLKVAGLFDGGYLLGQRLNRGETMTVTTVTTVPASNAIPLRSETVPLEIADARPPGRPWAQQALNYPDVTGSVAASKPPPKPPEPPAAKPPETKPAAEVPVAAAPPPPPQVSPAERAVLERLQERRQQLDARARELDMRENLLKAAEQKLQGPVAANPNPDQPGGVAPKDDAVANRFKSIVTMYESMKPKDAAKIFDRLDIKVLLEVSTQINPRKMSEILAVMSPEAAEKLTVELAARARNPNPTPNPTELPKIEGKPLGS